MIRGVVPVLGSPAQISAHEKLVKDAFASAQGRHSLAPRGTPVPNKQPLAFCTSEFEEELSFFTQDMCYRGGPVLHGPTIHLIFWQGKPGSVQEEAVKPFPEGPGKSAEGPGSYIYTVERYFEDVAGESGATTNVFAVDGQYGEESKEEYLPGEYAVSFAKPVDVTVDPASFPVHLTKGCTDKGEFSEGPCLLDSDIQAEVEEVAGTKEAGLKSIYVVLTPPGVGGCFESESGECAYRQYCAYHGDFGGNGETPLKQTIYADLPYLGNVPGCDSFVHPNEAPTSTQEQKEGIFDHGADAVIDTASHEINEAITDPLGSQCNEEAGKIEGCEPNAWTDAIGQEVADKCLPPETTIAGLNGIYGEPLVEGLGARAYNQVINGDHYWTQREWSNEAGPFEGACVQQVIEARASVSAGAAATVPVKFDGSASGVPGDPATYWVWDFGDGERAGTSSPTISHTYAKPGKYFVILTAYDAFGSSAWTAGLIEVGAAPAPTPPPPAPAPITIRELLTPAHLSAAELASKLGLPRNGTKLSGFGTISLGHAECPPACGVTLKLYATVRTTRHHRTKVKQVLIGLLRMTVANKGTGTLALPLNAAGRILLHKVHLASCKLLATVEGQEGGSWQITRTLTLTSAARSARRRR
ncbi:MAG TPA: PKD domain-containing protein [Solirubrobacteraceae bacterium]